jgi:hypothetical protein
MTIEVVSSALKDGTRIGVTTEQTPEGSYKVKITKGYGQYNSSANPSQYLFSDRLAYKVVGDDENTNNEGYLGKTDYPSQGWRFVRPNDKPNVLTATCDGYDPTQRLVLDVDGLTTGSSKTYDGKPVAARISKSLDWPSSIVPVPEVSKVKYFVLRDGRYHELDGAPTNAGTYQVRLEVQENGTGEHYMLSKDFSITSAPLTIKANDKTIAYGEAPANGGVTCEGFVGGDDQSILNGALSYEYLDANGKAYTAGSPAGTYTIKPVVAGLQNYTPTIETGTLTVMPAPEPKPEGLPDTVATKTIAHLQRKGTMAATTGVGKAVGTTGESRRLESLRLSLSGQPLSGGIEYCAHVQRVGWQDWVANGVMAGTQGKSRRMEAVQIRLTGQMAKEYDVYYRVHVQRYGWMAWAKNGAEAGSTGRSRRIEAVQVVIARKGSSAPGKTYNGVTQTYSKAFVTK